MSESTITLRKYFRQIGDKILNGKLKDDTVLTQNAMVKMFYDLAEDTTDVEMPIGYAKSFLLSSLSEFTKRALSDKPEIIYRTHISTMERMYKIEYIVDYFSNFILRYLLVSTTDVKSDLKKANENCKSDKVTSINEETVKELINKEANTEERILSLTMSDSYTLEEGSILANLIVSRAMSSMFKKFSKDDAREQNNLIYLVRKAVSENINIKPNGIKRALNEVFQILLRYKSQDSLPKAIVNVLNFSPKFDAIIRDDLTVYNVLGMLKELMEQEI